MPSRLSEAVSNAIWGGVALADVLAEAGPRAGALHAAFCGLDDTERHGKRFHFGGSIPIKKAMSPEVLLATEMNGEPLPPVHGFPLRVVVPGWIGARSVKWLHKVKLQPEPSDNYFQRVAYRLFPAAVGPDNVVWDEGAMLGEQATNAIVTSPLAVVVSELVAAVVSLDAAPMSLSSSSPPHADAINTIDNAAATTTPCK